MARILVVDDAGFLRMRVSKLLTANGYEVLEAENGVQAVARYRSEHPDAVLMDITMPEMDGLTALQEIRRNDPEARVVMLTALGQEALVLAAVKAGAKDFIVKPFEPDRVLSAIGSMLS